MGKILSYGQNPFLVIKVGRSSGNVSDSLGLQLPLGIFLTNSWKSGAILNTENGLYPERMLRSEIASKPWVARFQKSGYGPILLLSTDEPQPERIQKNDEYFCQFIFVCLIFHHFCVDSATFCSWFAGFSWSSLKTRQPQAGLAISMPSACSCWAVCRLCLSSATCTCALFWGWGWELH